MDIEEYSKVAPQYYTDEVPQMLIFLVKTHAYKSILDCGCGDGSLLHALNKRGFLHDKVVCGVDYSKSRVKLVKKINSKFTVAVDNAETLETIKNNSIDLFISTQVIEHVDDEKMINTMYRVIKKNGRVYLSTVFKKWYGWYFYRNETGWVLDPTHLREYQQDKQLTQYFKGKFRTIRSSKSLQWFPVIDFLAKRISRLTRDRDTWIWKLIRSIRIPILGYYNWEMILQKV
jgi:2-polyprenyl-3-methyl-5-hydroxy-6-metoxy-1,4-benzoquinol methylase